MARGEPQGASSADAARARPLGGLERRLGYQFKNAELLRRALTHRSYANEMEEEVADNEVMEFLGDAVLGLVVSELLYRRHPELTEGQMSKVKAFLVSAESLARRGESLGLGAFLQLGRGEEKTAGRAKDSLLANSLEAVIAAVYLDGGLEIATDFVDRQLWGEVAEAIAEDAPISDWKSMLQERLQSEGRSLPAYRVIDELGPDHDKTFRVEVLVDGAPLADGQGRTKKAAEQVAAERALELLGEPE